MLDQPGNVVAATLRPTDQPVRLQRVRLRDDLVEREIDVRGFARRPDAFINLPGAFRAAELGLKIGPAVDTFRAVVGSVRTGAS